MTLLARLDRSPLVHVAIDRLGGRRVADAWLARWPRTRHPAPGIVYRCRSLDAVAVADELFARAAYDPGIPAGVTTFADLGCHAGLFVVRLAERSGRRDLRGLAVDADPRMVSETRWALDANGLGGVTALHGAVAGPGASGPVDFFLNPCRVLSSRFPVDEPGVRSKGEWTRTEAPALDVERAWREAAGDVPCDLLKIDVEGSEADFLVPENPFLARVRSVLLEWHGWAISREEVGGRLRAMGFLPGPVLELLPSRGVEAWSRPDPR